MIYGLQWKLYTKSVYFILSLQCLSDNHSIKGAKNSDYDLSYPLALRQYIVDTRLEFLSAWN